MKNYIFVSYFWGNEKYKNFSLRWKNACKKIGVDYYVAEMQQFAKPGLYQIGINYKPKFILDMLLKFPKKAVIYTDIDTILHREPTLFENKQDVDMMCLNWNYDPALVSNNCFDPLVMETAGPVFFFNNTNPVKKVLRLWYNSLNQPQYAKCADDRVLGIVFHSHKLINSIRVQWLPIEYLYFSQFFSHLKLDKKTIVISHPESMTSEDLAHKLGSAVDRIPQDYKVQYSVRNKAKKLILNYSTEPLSLEKRLKKVGFKFFKSFELPKNLKTTKLVKFNIDLDPQEIIKLWKTNYCDVIIGNYTRNIDLDIGTTAHNDNGILKFKLPYENAGIYLKCTDTTYTFVKQWSLNYNESKHTLKTFQDTFNSNATFRMRLRYENIS
uniref:Nucleotide-diphospho-sugar transferase domain-containing protein n=1 Tax=viral metagenome TaxID=1070528 RepID=A0A6C0F681_9ZZZZ|tara:strand:- start:2356 stop:3501 length:1146 start_codon:yes stop_codon:yes gene_type:complete